MRRPASFLLAAVLLATGWSAAQTVPVPAPAPGGIQVTPAATPADGLISALKKSLAAEARGEAVLELVFPPSAKPLRSARSLPRLGAVPALIRRNFTVTVAPDTVAGRVARRYDLTPANPQAARWVIWIDAQWNVPLAYQERMPGGSLARRAELTSVNPGLSRLAQAGRVQAVRPALKRALLSALPGLKLPSGFEPLSVQLQTGAAGNTSVEVLLSDGLNVLALVVSPRPVKAASGVSVRRLGGQSVWLVGDLPQGELDDALSGIRRLDAQAVSDLPGTFGDPTASDQ